MADLTDVANTLVGIIAGVVYPNGTSQPSVTGQKVKIFQGWPDSAELNKWLQGNGAQISVFPLTTEKTLPMRLPEWQQLSLDAPAITAVVDGVTVTYAGAGGKPQNAAVLVDGIAYVYAIQTSDTPAAIAAALASLIGVDRAASSAGAVLTITNSHYIVARIGVHGTSIQELRRQERQYQISIWANCYDQRDPLAELVDVALSALVRIDLPDGSQGIVRYKGSIQNDSLQKSGIYRRDLMYSVEYSTTQTRIDTQIVTERLNISIVPLKNGTAVAQISINS